MISSSLFVIICAVLVSNGWAAPAPAIPDLFSGLFQDINLNFPEKKSDIVKRRIVEDNPDSELKQVSLRALIGDLERSLFESALSVSGVVNDKSAVLQEVTPSGTGGSAATHSEAHSTVKRDAEELTSGSTENPRIVLQTTAKAPVDKSGYPGHVLIDRISVQPYFGGSPIIPSFQVNHSKLVPEGTNATTHLSISKKTIGTTTASEAQIESAVDNATATQVHQVIEAAKASSAAHASTNNLPSSTILKTDN